MNTRPDWAMDRAAAILATLYTQLPPTEKLNYIADLLVTTRLDGEIAATDASKDRALQGIDSAIRRFLAGPPRAQAAE